MTKTHVWIRPTRNLGGNGYGFYGGFGGFGYGLALGSITGIALSSAFWW
ncbi:hypothetical protein [Jeotgalibacillus soli]|uniref:Uncharacterized protein n=1 Tax=Jeotgalibacillus soli TaxID=889306 RepID=A0A0C2R4R4_9BACL|nr:hypothetical protein KP78_28090 [Jeotgalibacillus soli]